MNEPDKSMRNVAASVRARLLNKARAEKLDFSLLLTRSAGEDYRRQWHAGIGWDGLK